MQVVQNENEDAAIRRFTVGDNVATGRRSRKGLEFDVAGARNRDSAECGNFLPPAVLVDFDFVAIEIRHCSTVRVEHPHLEFNRIDARAKDRERRTLGDRDGAEERSCPEAECARWWTRHDVPKRRGPADGRRAPFSYADAENVRKRTSVRGESDVRGN